MSDRPRVLFVGRGRYSLPLPQWLAKKWDAIEPELDYRLLGAAEDGSASERRAVPARQATAPAPARRGALPRRAARFASVAS